MQELTNAASSDAKVMKTFEDLSLTSENVQDATEQLRINKCTICD